MDNRAPTTRANSASSFSRFGELAAVFFKTKFSDGLLALPVHSCRERLSPHSPVLRLRLRAPSEFDY